jgi:hypothetical protein
MRCAPRGLEQPLGDRLPLPLPLAPCPGATFAAFVTFVIFAKALSTQGHRLDKVPSVGAPDPECRRVRSATQRRALDHFVTGVA